MTYALHLLLALVLHVPAVHGGARDAAGGVVAPELSCTPAIVAAAATDLSWRPPSGDPNERAAAATDGAEDSDEDEHDGVAPFDEIALAFSGAQHVRSVRTSVVRPRADRVAAHAPRGPPAA